MKLEEARIGMKVRYIGPEDSFLKKSQEVTVNGIFHSNIQVLELNGTAWLMKPEEFESIEIGAGRRPLTIQELGDLARHGWTADDIVLFKQEGVL